MVCSLVTVYERSAHLVKEMEEYGVRVDIRMVKSNLSILEKIKEQLKVKHQQDHGEPFVDSWAYLSKVFDKQGWKYPKTPKGRGHFSENALKDNTDVNPDYKNFILSYRQLTYHIALFKSFMEADDWDRIHPKYHLARTGRFRCVGPNIQNLSSKSYPNSPRDCIIPDKDSRFIALDYSQGEYRLLADYIGNKKLISALNEGADFHQYTADEIKVSRAQAKNINFAFIYGAGDVKLAEMMQVGVQEAREHKQNMSNLFGIGLKRFIETCSNHRVKKWTGIEIDVDETYKGVNYVIQGGLADIVRNAMLLCDKKLIRQTHLLLTLALNIHDENVYQLTTNLEHTEEIALQLKEYMEEAYNKHSLNGIRMRVDATVNIEGQRASLDKGNFKKVNK